jgi:hypothetical protein
MPTAHLIAKVKAAIIAEFARQIPMIYFWDPADKELFDGGQIDTMPFADGVILADRFDLDAVAVAAIKALTEGAE